MPGLLRLRRESRPGSTRQVREQNPLVLLGAVVDAPDGERDDQRRIAVRVVCSLVAVHINPQSFFVDNRKRELPIRYRHEPRRGVEMLDVMPCRSPTREARVQRVYTKTDTLPTPASTAATRTRWAASALEIV